MITISFVVVVLNDMPMNDITHNDVLPLSLPLSIQPSQIDNLYMMLTLLTTGMHQTLPGSKVIWYDSVTTAGELKWQNRLNEMNEYD